AALLADAPDIERDALRLRELQAVLPAVKTALEQQHGIEDAARQLNHLTEQQQKVEQELARADEELLKAREKRKTVEEALGKEERQLHELSARRRERTGQREKLREYERLEQQLAPLHDEIQKLPVNPAAEVKKSRESWEHLSELAQAAPPLARLAEVRHELADAVRREH